MQFPVAEAIKPLSKYLLSRNVDKITIFISPNAYYEMLGNTLEAQISDKLNVKKQIVPADSLDYRTELTKIRQETNTAIVVFLLENGPASTFVKQAKNIGIDPGRLILGPIVRYDEVLKKDHALTEGIIHLDYSVPIPKDFQEMYLTRFKSEPAFGSVLAYDAVYLLKYGIEMCGDDGSKLVDCLAKVNFKGKSGPVKFDQNRNRIITNEVTKIYKITNGTFIQLP